MRTVLMAMMLAAAAAAAVPGTARAETVGVRNAGDVDLSAFDCTAIPESQLLHRICYDAAHRYVVAQVGEDYYDSCNVGPKAVDGLFETSHAVAYYNQKIRAQHRCTAALRAKIGVATVGGAAR